MRIKLKTIEQYHFSMDLHVRITDINYGQHLGNEMLLVYAQQARVEWLRQWGYGELTLAGKGIIMTDTAIVYQSEAHEGDHLQVDLAVDEVSKIGFDLYYKVSQKKNQRVVARIKTGILCFDYDLKKIAPLPAEFAQILSNLLG